MKRTPFFAFTTAVLALVVLGTAPVFADEQCSQRSVAGDWGYTVTGTRIVNNVPLAAASVGSFHLDHDGNLSGAQTLSIGGTIVQGEILTGTLTVNSDCTATSVIVVSNTPFPRTSTLDLVFTDSANRARSIFTNAGTILTVESERIHHEND